VKLVAVIVATVVLVGGAGCSKRSDALGSGSDIDACVAYDLYDRIIPEPSPTRADDLLVHAEAVIRIVARIRGDYKIRAEGKDDFLADQSVLDAWATVGRSMGALRDAVRAAGNDPARLKVAANALGADEAFLAADRRIADFFVNDCPHSG
jgi:hypothetical protein